MDLDEWEILPNEKFLDYHEDDDAKTSPNPKGLFKVNHFMCPSSPPKRFSRVVPNHVVPVPIQLEPPSTSTGKYIDGVSDTSSSSYSKQVTKVVPSDISLVPCVIMPDVKNPISSSTPTTTTLPKEADDQDSVSSQVFFKKTDQFVDKILDSPKSCNFVASPQIDVFTSGDQGMEGKISSPRTPRMKKDQENVEQEDQVGTWEENSGGLNLWKWSLTGIGAICSFGVAAATICIIIFGSQQRNKQRQQNQKLRFQIYTDDKRIKHVVQHATKLNEAISAARGVPIQRAHITIGGYYDGL